MIPSGIPVRIDRTEPGTGKILRRALDLIDELIHALENGGDGVIAILDGSAHVRARLPAWREDLQVQVPTDMIPRTDDMNDAAFAIAIVESVLEAVNVSDGDAAFEAIEAHRGRGMAFLEASGIDLDDPRANELHIYAPTPWMQGGQSLYPLSRFGGRTTSIRPVPQGPAMLVVYASSDVQNEAITINIGGHFDKGVPTGPIARLRASAAWQRHVASIGAA